MACRQIWEDVYALEVFQSGTSLSAITGNQPAFTGTHGVRGDWTGTGTGDLTHKYNLLVDDAYPVVKAANTVVEKNLVTGDSLQNIVSVTQVTSKPDSVVIPVVFNAHNLSAFFYTFFQDGVTINSGTTNTALEILTCVPYSDACPTIYSNLVRFRQDAADSDEVDQTLHAVVPTRILIRGEEGGLIDGEVEFLGAKWEDYDLSGKLTTAQGFDTTAPLKFEDLTVKLDGVEVSIPSFECTFENGLVHQYYNQVSAQSVTLGKMMFTGTITIPWNDATAQGLDKQIDDFRAGNMKRLSLVWGNPSFTQFSQGDTGTTDYGGTDIASGAAKNSIVNNYFAIHAYVRIMDYDETEIDEVPMIPFDFKALKDSDGTMAGVTSYVAYDVSKNTWTP